MTTQQTALSKFLTGYTAEVTSGDGKSIKAASEKMAPGSEVFVASLPKNTLDDLVAAIVKLSESGLNAVPHIVARNIKDYATLDELLGRLVKDAGCDRALVLGGDRDEAVGEYSSSLELIETGLFEKHGIKKIYIGSYPEGHARIPDDVLEQAIRDKLAAAEKAGLEVELVTQFCFDAKPFIEMARRFRAQGITAPLRAGVAGPANRMTLIKYAMACGVGASLRALKERQDMAKNMIVGETPEGLLAELAEANEADPSLGLSGVHFFTFGSLIKSADFASEHMAG
ncbi:methylenetetrahydrofolate reductase [Emcibacter sp.]|uniref:methylenetetrahydrofolate reductase n=1 Tax=Emcibacter sp. TaxID=1979954 RepID=UPI002AA880DD|nr:methylenetetrahydrofolate reductase [Emcibacter sp.]